MLICFTVFPVADFFPIGVTKCIFFHFQVNSVPASKKDVDMKGLALDKSILLILEIRLPQNLSKVDLVIYGLFCDLKFQSWCSKSWLKPIHIVQVIL